MPKKMVCTTCNTIAEPAVKNNGSFVVEIVVYIVGIAISAITALWFLMLVPVGFTLFRVFGRMNHVCPSCGSDALVPLDSPKGKEIAAAASNGSSS